MEIIEKVVKTWSELERIKDFNISFVDGFNVIKKINSSDLVLHDTLRRYGQVVEKRVDLKHPLQRMLRFVDTQVNSLEMISPPLVCAKIRLGLLLIGERPELEDPNTDTGGDSSRQQQPVYIVEPEMSNITSLLETWSPHYNIAKKESCYEILQNVLLSKESATFAISPATLRLNHIFDEKTIRLLNDLRNAACSSVK